MELNKQTPENEDEINLNTDYQDEVYEAEDTNSGPGIQQSAGDDEEESEDELDEEQRALHAHAKLRMLNGSMSIIQETDECEEDTTIYNNSMVTMRDSQVRSSLERQSIRFSKNSYKRDNTSDQALRRERTISITDESPVTIDREEISVGKSPVHIQMLQIGK
jgi:hypothetical protein